MKKGLVVALVVGMAAALGFVAQRVLPGKESVADSVAATMSEEPETLEPVVPETLPHFELADRDGTLRSLGHWQGQPLMVNYWATWCGPCRREIPLLNELRAEYQSMNLEIIGIAVDFREDVLAYAEDNPISYPLLIGEEDGLEAVKAMGVATPAFPFTVFADSQHRILTIKMGELHRDDGELILDRLAQVDSGALPLPEARQQIAEGLKELATRRAATRAAGD